MLKHVLKHYTKDDTIQKTNNSNTESEDHTAQPEKQDESHDNQDSNADPSAAQEATSPDIVVTSDESTAEVTESQDKMAADKMAADKVSVDTPHASDQTLLEKPSNTNRGEGVGVKVTQQDMIKYANGFHLSAIWENTALIQ